jgi:peroxiredoxin Q/BCP
MPSRRSKFKLGDRAPQFSLPYDETSEFSFEDHLNRGPLLVGFMRGTWCPSCRKFLKQLLESWDAIDAVGCEVVVIATQSLSPLVQFSRQEKLPFKILADVHRKVTREYGIHQPISWTGVNVARPSVFLLNERGRIVYQYIGSMTDRPLIPQVVAQLERMQRQRKSSMKA